MMMKKVGSALGTLAFLAVMAFAMIPSVKGFVFAQIWQATGVSPIEMLIGENSESLSCGGNMSMTVRNHTQVFEGDEALIVAGGSCKMRIIDSDIRAVNAIRTGGDATVIIEGGRIEGTEMALNAAGSGTIEVRGAEIVGPVRGKGKIIGLDEGEGTE